jgi:hypothetical protein
MSATSVASSRYRLAVVFNCMSCVNHFQDRGIRIEISGKAYHSEEQDNKLRQAAARAALEMGHVPWTMDTRQKPLRQNRQDHLKILASQRIKCDLRAHSLCSIWCDKQNACFTTVVMFTHKRMPAATHTYSIACELITIIDAGDVQPGESQWQCQSGTARRAGRSRQHCMHQIY